MKIEAKVRVPRCHRCGKHFERVIAPAHVQKMKYDGRRHDVLVEGMPRWRCEACDVTATDDASDIVVQDSLRRHIGLLTAAEIREARTALGLTQADLAGLLGCAAESVSRWENAAILQSRTYDRMLRLVFQLPTVRQLLGSMGQDCPIGRHAVAGAGDPSKGVVEAMKALTRIWEGAAACSGPEPRPRGVAGRGSRVPSVPRMMTTARMPQTATAPEWVAAVNSSRGGSARRPGAS
jgi:putative zinc finger/helix-turn-helix YgiT family protein